MEINEPNIDLFLRDEMKKIQSFIRGTIDIEIMPKEETKVLMNEMRRLYE